MNASASGERLSEVLPIDSRPSASHSTFPQSPIKVSVVDGRVMRRDNEIVGRDISNAQHISSPNVLQLAIDNHSTIVQFGPIDRIPA
jgi:hypothetical protein